MEQKFVSRQQLNLLEERITFGLRTFAAYDLWTYLLELSNTSKNSQVNVLIVGSGGSYPACVFAKHVIIEQLKNFTVEATTPQTAIRMINELDNLSNNNSTKFNLVIGISYSGKTADIIAIAKLCKLKSCHFLLLTGAKKDTLSEIYSEDDLTKIISYFSVYCTESEKGLISMASTLTPMYIFNAIRYPKPPHLISKFPSELDYGKHFITKLNIDKIVSSLKRTPIIHVFYEWDTLPTALDIESKFIESGIATVILHEKKNFSHGRTTLLYTQQFALIINLCRYKYSCSHIDKTPYKKVKFRTQYDEILTNYLKSICNITGSNYMELFATSPSITTSQWNLWTMAILPYLITEIGEKMNIDISRPLDPYPKETLTLYNYNGEL